MKLVCKCLNIIIEANDTVESLDDSFRNTLSARAPQSQKLVMVKCESIINRIDILIEVIGNGDWPEYFCRNCNVWMYSCRKNGKDECNPIAVVDKSRMINHADYEDLMAHPNYSPIFKILIFDQTDPVNMSEGMKESLRLHPIARAWIDQQTVLAESRITNFVDQQYADLERKRMQAHSQQFALRRALSSDKLILEKERIKPFAMIQKKEGIEVLAMNSAGVTPTVDIAAKENAPPSIIDPDLEFDDSILLESTDSDDSPTTEDSDDEGIDPRSRRMSEPMVARSLPIPVPHYLEALQSDDRRETSPQTPDDIAANIRALAQSAHGDQIFGELPPPRFTRN